jgi:hypothetical protein
MAGPRWDGANGGPVPTLLMLELQHGSTQKNKLVLQQAGA